MRRPPPPPASADADNTVGGPANAVGSADVGSDAATTGSRAAARLPLRPALPSLPAPVLRSAVRSRWSRPAAITRSTAGQCRAQCALQRQSCSGGQGDTSGCDPGWTQCLSACAGISYGRAP